LWQGQQVRLRAVEPGDWEAFFAWGADPEIARDCYYIPFPQSRERAQKWAAEVATAEPKDDAFRWVIETLDGMPVGTLNTYSCDRRNGTFGYGLAIAREHWRKGYAAEAIRVVLGYYFRELRYQKCTVHVYAFNEPSIHLHEKLGFQLEGRLRRTIFTDGMYHDELVFGITAEEFEMPQSA
jgi:RimJ/RimL family protein N-acetyltransferase